MAKVINKNVANIQKVMQEDETLISEVKNVLSMVKNGKMENSIISSTNNKTLEELKVLINDMLQVISLNICSDITKIQNALNEYNKLNFTHKIQNATGYTSDGLNALAEMIYNMLVENKNNGMVLEDSSVSLLSNVTSLRNSSNNTKQDLDETSLLLLQITSDIEKNTNIINDMSQFAKKVTVSALDAAIQTQINLKKHILSYPHFLWSGEI